MMLVDPFWQAGPATGVELVTQSPGGYTGPGGTWEPGAETVTPIQGAVIQQASMRTAQMLIEQGGITQASDARVVYLTDGTTLMPDDDGTFAQILRFEGREWRVREADNRPWRNYCKAVVVRYRGSN